APIVLDVMARLKPDVVCLQETKTPDEFFPYETFEGAGYKYIHAHGMKSYNGVAVLSKLPFDSFDIHHRCQTEDCRRIAVNVGGVLLHNLCIPAGGDEPDPVINGKYKHKLDFVDEMTGWFKKNFKPTDPMVAL